MAFKSPGSKGYFFNGVLKLVDVCGTDSVGLIACYTTRPPKTQCLLSTLWLPTMNLFLV